MKKQFYVCAVLCTCFLLFAQSISALTCNSLKKSLLVYANPETLSSASDAGWCTDGAGSKIFNFASKNVYYLDPETGEEVNQTGVSLLNVKGTGGNKGAVFFVSGISDAEVCFRSGSTVERFVKMDLTDSNGETVAYSCGHDGLAVSPVLRTQQLNPAEEYKITLSGWSDAACMSGADCQIIYIRFNVIDNAGKSQIAYVYDSSYATYIGLYNDPVYQMLSKDYDVKAIDVKFYNSTPGATFTENLKEYDLVVLTEAVSGTHKFGIACKELVGKVPVLNFKAFYYSSGRWGWATPANPIAGATGWNQIQLVMPEHPLFENLPISDDNNIALIDASVGSKNTVQSFSAPSGFIQNDPILAINGANGYAAIHSRISEQEDNGYLMIPLSYDAVSAITPAGLDLIDNAVSLLISTKGKYIAPQQVATPRISQQDGMISISTDTPGAAIYYAINDPVTSVGALLYTTPFKMAASGTVSAVAVKSGMLSSEISETEISVLPVFSGKPDLLDPEKLDRGLIAYKTPAGNLISWRLLGTDSVFTTSFKVYRDGLLLTPSPLVRGTNFLDRQGNNESSYVVETYVEGVLTEATIPVNVWEKGYLNIALDRPASATNASGAYEYIPGDASVGDVDGDGEYEIILKWDPSNQQDNSLRGYTGNVFIDCYKLDGRKLWRIDLGRNIRAGAHYTQLMVYDLDGDGKAEIACKTAPGTIDGKGKYVLLNNDDPSKLYLGSSGSTTGVVTGGPEYLTIFNGQTGAETITIPYEPARGASTDWGKDSYFNRSERYLACVAYLDGKRPSLVMCRGYYQRAAIVAYDFDGANLVKRWIRDDKTAGVGCYGEGAHSLAVGDVDGDGCDEIVFGSACIDHDGSMLYRTGFGHGDALHLGDFDPDREGLEIFMVHEESSSKYDTEFRDARTGQVIWGLKQSGQDIGRGVCADIDSTRRGVESWPIGNYSSGTRVNSVFDCKGTEFSVKRPSVNFRIYWMDNLSEQVFEKGAIDRWLCTSTGGTANVVDFVKSYGCGTNLIKSTPNLQADILGDWREEVILYDTLTKSNLMIFPTPYPTTYRIPTLMHDHLYRMSVCWQNVAYNQPPHVGYYLPDYANYIASHISTTVSPTQADSDKIELECGPIRHNLEVSVKVPQPRTVTFSLYNTSGVKVCETSIFIGSSQTIILDGLSSLPGGIYFLTASDTVGQTVIKTIK